MAEFKLNLREKLVDSFQSKPIYLAKRDYQIYLVLSLILFLGGGFFTYSYFKFQEAMYIVLTLIFTLSGVGGLLFYLFKLFSATKLSGVKKYYLTDTRLVITNQDDHIIREILLNRIKRVDVEKYGFNTGTIILNKRIDQSRKAQLKQRKTLRPVYSPETVLIESIGNLKRVTSYFDMLK